MYKLHYLNFGWDAIDEFKTVDEALRVAVRMGYESYVHDGAHNIIAWYSPITGIKRRLL